MIFFSLWVSNLWSYESVSLGDLLLDFDLTLTSRRGDFDESGDLGLEPEKLDGPEFDMDFESVRGLDFGSLGLELDIFGDFGSFFFFSFGLDFELSSGPTSSASSILKLPR